MFKLHNHSTRQSSQNFSHSKTNETAFKHDISHLYIRLFSSSEKSREKKRRKKEKNVYMIAHKYMCKRKIIQNARINV